MTTPAQPRRIAWEQFSLDPRREENAAMRASDRDRDVALTALNEAFADGRLDRAELDERMVVVHTGKRLGDLVWPIADLAPSAPARTVADVAGPADADLQARAERNVRAARASSLWVFLVPTVICWVIWASASVSGGGFHPQFPWPLFVMLGTGARAFSALRGDRAAEVVRERRRLVERERREARRELRDVRRTERDRRRLGDGY
ncbi:hypothetical protein GCM10011519_32080 [Marmoricola endophyticus]|uniref:DUF1707 domain-containing protein n=1 Tax=Marmoricola endophyticus TaxID=2040280 RepID=A0A917BTH3_9ACTN|nr:DUF1707 domain-containing protein [Marmoricola endophyticus]GGF55728.1 hypothetical protein GCM10011519_32080 [Marmoricola endophyticus]